MNDGDNPLKGVPLWKVIALVGLGGAFVLWGEARTSAAIAADNGRDDGVYASRDEVQALDARLIRIEEKVDQIRGILTAARLRELEKEGK